MSNVATRQSPSRSPGAASKKSQSPCVRCNEVHTGCTGHSKKSGKACRSQTMNGADVCPQHGRGKHIVEAAARRYKFAQQEGEIANLLREADLPNQHPLDGLLEVVRHTGAMMRVLSGLCAQLEETGEVSVHYDEKDQPHYRMVNNAIVGVNHDGDGAAHVLVLLYEKWSGLYMRACKTALDANIDERMVRNATATGDAFLSAFTVALNEAQLQPDQSARLSKALARELRSLVSPVAGLPIGD